MIFSSSILSYGEFEYYKYAVDLLSIVVIRFALWVI